MKTIVSYGSLGKGGGVDCADSPMANLCAFVACMPKGVHVHPPHDAKVVGGGSARSG